jgi:BMFP domain-containing protein YqiC
MKNYGGQGGSDRHANARDRKRENAKKMVVTNRGIFTLQDTIARRGREAHAALEARRIELDRAQRRTTRDHGPRSNVAGQRTSATAPGRTKVLPPHGTSGAVDNSGPRR